jgi:hypothetical protein
MRTKVVEIEFCGDCPHFIFDDDSVIERFGKAWCRKVDAETTYYDGIPKWCPLPDDSTDCQEKLKKIREILMEE